MKRKKRRKSKIRKLISSGKKLYDTLAVIALLASSFGLLDGYPDIVSFFSRNRELAVQPSYPISLYIQFAVIALVSGIYIWWRVSQMAKDSRNRSQ